MMFVEYQLTPDGDHLREYYPEEYTPAKCLYEFKKAFEGRAYNIVTVGIKFNYRPKVDYSFGKQYLVPKVKKRKTYFGRYVD